MDAHAKKVPHANNHWAAPWLGWSLLLVVPSVFASADASAADSAAELASRIDAHIAHRCQQANVPLAPRSTDAEFLRRVYLDLVGTIPTVSETRSFLSDESPEKRATTIRRLQKSPGFARHQASFWRRVWIPQAELPEFDRLAGELETWLAGRIRDGAAYDALVHELLAVEVTGLQSDGAGAASTPRAFLAAGEYKPELLAANTARAFLGVNLDCAQCHDHPFARWTREQFWQTAAFFVRPSAAGSTQTASLELTIPETRTSVVPTLLDATEVRWPDEIGADTPRRVLANWVASRENPYLAPNAVNRLWYQFFGAGLIEPLDDISAANGSVHSALVDLLAAELVAHDFDMSYLGRAIVLSQTYQRTSAGESLADEPRLFARMAVRSLSGDQLYSCLRVAGGLAPLRSGLDSPKVAQRRQEFVELMDGQPTATAERSIVQALAMMNGDVTARLTDAQTSPVVSALASTPFLRTRDRVATLVMAALNREPDEEECRLLVDYIDRRSEENRRAALAEVFWTLINSSEFSTNH